MNAKFEVQEAFEKVLKRSPSPDGLAHWTNFLSSGSSQTRMEEAMRTSREAIHVRRQQKRGINGGHRVLPAVAATRRMASERTKSGNVIDQATNACGTILVFRWREDSKASNAIRPAGTGSGFFVKDASRGTLLVTAAHVVVPVPGLLSKSSTPYLFQKDHVKAGVVTEIDWPWTYVVEMETAENGRQYEQFILVGFDWSTDTAVLESVGNTEAAATLEMAPWALDNEPTKGTEIVALGDPESLDFASPATGTVRESVYDVSTVWPVYCLCMLQIQHGYSGAPVIDASTGQILGMVAAQPSIDQGSNITLALHRRVLFDSIESIVNAKTSTESVDLDVIIVAVERQCLGFAASIIRIQDIVAALPPAGGLVVRSVDPLAPAKSLLRQDDIITHVNGVALKRETSIYLLLRDSVLSGNLSKITVTFERPIVGQYYQQYDNRTIAMTPAIGPFWEWWFQIIYLKMDSRTNSFSKLKTGFKEMIRKDLTTADRESRHIPAVGTGVVSTLTRLTSASIRGTTVPSLDPTSYLTAVIEDLNLFLQGIIAQSQSLFHRTPFAYKISEDCIACGACIDTCPVNAISEGEFYKINPDECTDCGMCAEVCPTEAISQM
jgi:S1-C subfamily serine protease/ferredoxin